MARINQGRFSFAAKVLPEPLITKSAVGAGGGHGCACARGDRGITTGLDIVKGFQDEDYCRRLLEATVWRIVV
jgi:hypothetical protein